MAKQAEIDYLRNAGPEAAAQALDKPFSDPDCGLYLMEIGAVMTLLPPPPARLLDVGCGTGWTSAFFARRGYRVTGVDIAPDMIAQAQRLKEREGLANLDFVVRDYEDMAFPEPFDSVVFYNSLHHAVDEALAVRAVYGALRPGGVCVTSEPGRGHGQSAEARAAVARYGVTEKDMPPRLIVQLGRAAGFTGFRVYPNAHSFGRVVYSAARARSWKETTPLALLARLVRYRRGDNGIVVLTK